MQADHDEETKARRGRILRLTGIFKGLALGFCILFVSIAAGTFAISDPAIIEDRYRNKEGIDDLCDQGMTQWAGAEAPRRVPEPETF